MTKRVFAIPVALVLIAAGSNANAAVISVNCTIAPHNQLFNLITGVSPPNPGDTIQITGICVNPSNQTMSVRIPLTFGNSTLSNSFSASDGNQGQFEVIGTGATFNGLFLEGGSADNPGVVYGNVFAHNGAHVLIENSLVENGQRFGVLAARGAGVVVFHSTIAANGLANLDNDTDGIAAVDGSSILLGDNDGSGNPDITKIVDVDLNAHGHGVSARRGSAVQMWGSAIHDNGAPEVLVYQDSSMRIIGTLNVFATVSALSTATWPAIFVAGASSLQLQGGGAMVDGVAGGITVAGTSTILLRGSAVTNNSASTQAIVASYDSSIILAGANSITNSGGGNALQVDHSSSLVENDGSLFGFSAAGDSITGKGVVQVESSMELGTGGATPSTWTGNINVAQNSSFRMVGGMAITGSVALNQASNGFFRINNGGTNGVSGGVTCPASAGNPSSHVSNPTLVTPNVTVGATFATTTPPACLQF